MPAARALAALVLIALVAGCGSSHNGGTGQFGAAPPGGSSASGGPGGSASPGGPGPTDVPAGTVTGGSSASTSAGAADLRASYHVDKDLLGTKTTVAVTLTNQGTGDVSGWTVIMGLSGVALTVSTPPQVKHEARDGQHVFTPNGAGSTIRPGDEISFSFTVGGLVNVTSCTANGHNCTQV